MTFLHAAFLLLAVHVPLTVLPAAAGLFAAWRYGVRDRLLLWGIGLCGLLASGYLTFWVYWADALAGRIFAVLLTILFVVVVAILGFQQRDDLKSIGSGLLRPFVLWIVSSLLIFSLGAMYTSSPVLTTSAEYRFLPILPIDNEVPLITAHALESSHRPIPHPLYGEWDSSDRPLLQAGVYLSQEALLPGSDAGTTDYVIVGVLLQGLWIFGIWSLLAAVRARARLTALVLTGILFSGCRRQHLLHVAKTARGGLSGAPRSDASHPELQEASGLSRRRRDRGRAGRRGPARTRGQRPRSRRVRRCDGDPTEVALEALPP